MNDELHPEQQVVSSERASTDAVEATRHQRILVVEDEANVRSHIVDTVCDIDEAFQVEAVGDGVEALEVIESQSDGFDLIISDISMPRMDGETLLWELGNRTSLASVIMLTAFGQDDHVIHCLRAGACDYLVKPVSIEELTAAVLNAVQYRPKVSHPVSVDYDPSGWFEISGASDYTVLYRYRRFLGLLDQFRHAEPIAEEVRLALEELGRNAIEWGNQCDGSKQVRFACRILPSKVIIQVSDEGKGFDVEDVPDPSVDPIQHVQNRMAAGKRLGGYGIHLIRNLMDKVVYNSRGNVVVAIKYLDSPSDED